MRNWRRKVTAASDNYMNVMRMTPRERINTAMKLQHPGSGAPYVPVQHWFHQSAVKRIRYQSNASLARSL